MCEPLPFQLGFQDTVECQVPGEKCTVADPRSWLSGPCFPSQLLSYTPPEQTLHSVPVMFWWRNTVSAQGWDGETHGQVPAGCPGREGFLEEECPRGQVSSDSVMLRVRPWCLDGSV